MFDYKLLDNSGYFYVEFKDSVDRYLVEDLIRYWYRGWFKKDSEVYFNWINKDAPNTNDLIEIKVNIRYCTSINYVIKDFINADIQVRLDRRRSLRRILTEGVNTSTCKLKGVNTDINIFNELKLDIPNPYVNSFNVVTDLTQLVNKRITEEDNKLNKLFDELDCRNKYAEMRLQLTKLEILQKILELSTELDNL